jgi:hypothetical protein
MDMRLEAAVAGTLGSVPPQTVAAGILPASERGFQPPV